MGGVFNAFGADHQRPGLHDRGEAGGHFARRLRRRHQQQRVAFIERRKARRDADVGAERDARQ